jgi:hypothetical protein
MSLAELVIAAQDMRRRSVVALIAFVHYAKRNTFGFTFKQCNKTSSHILNIQEVSQLQATHSIPLF